MTPEEIIDALAVDRSPRSLRNVLGPDERFVRSGTATWALKEWELDEYTGLRELIRAEIEAGGGQVGITELIRKLTEGFGVSEASVRIYAGTHPFRNVDGKVQFGDLTKGPERRARNPKRFYKSPNGWRYRLTVNAEHLRGSGFPLPAGAAHALGIPRGERRTLASDLGPVQLGWTSPQPTHGSILRFLKRINAVAGDQVFLVFTGDRFDLVPLGPLPDDALGAAAALCGADSGDQDLWAYICLAVGLAEDSSRAAVVDALLSRGEDDLAESVARAPQPGQADDQTPGRAGEAPDIDDLLAGMNG
jgi:hypothetical protein